MEGHFNTHLAVWDKHTVRLRVIRPSQQQQFTRTATKSRHRVKSILSFGYVLSAASIIFIYLIIPTMILFSLIFHDSILQLLAALLLLSVGEYSVCTILAKTTLQPSTTSIELQEVYQQPSPSIIPLVPPRLSLPVSR